jgi:uncharacterized protein
MLTIRELNNIALTSQHHQKQFGLDAHFLPTNEPKPVAIFIHGINGFKDWGHFPLIANYMASKGFVWIKFNLSHNGTTYMRPTKIVDLEAYGNDLFTTDLDDIGLVINYLESAECPFSQEMDLNKITLVGHSRGGALAILKAAEDTRVKVVATWASIHSPYHFWGNERIEEVLEKGVIYTENSRTHQSLPLYKAYYEDILFDTTRLDVESSMGKLQVPILIAHGTEDTSVTPDKAHLLKQWQPNAELLMIEGTNHTFGGSHPYLENVLPESSLLLADKTADFLKKSLE